MGSLGLVLALLCCFTLPATAHEWDPSRTLKTEIPAGDLRSVDFNFGAGSVKIEGTAGSVVRLRVEARCDDESDSRCEKVLERLRIESRVESGRLDLELHGLSNGHIHDLDLDATLEIPRTLALDLDMGAGEIEIDGLESAIDIDLGAGEATIRVPERAVPSLFDASAGFRIRNASYRASADVSELVASRDLRTLVEAGLLEPRGERRGRFYRRGQRLADIDESYGYGFAGTSHDGYLALLLAEERQLDKALRVTESYAAGRHEYAMQVFALGLLAKLRLLAGDRPAAGRCARPPRGARTCRSGCSDSQ